MPHSMAHPPGPLASAYFSDNDEDNGAPEEISAAAAKKEIKTFDASLKAAQATQRQAKKQKNRDLDKKLKERSGKNNSEKGKNNVPILSEQSDEEQEEPEDSALQARMRQAMQDAQDEDDEDFGEEFLGISEQGPSHTNFSTESDTGDDQDSDENTEARRPEMKTKKTKVGHLPDELFTAAFRSEPGATKKRKADAFEGPAPKKQRKKKNPTVTIKDASNRTIQVLPSGDVPSIPSTVPSKKIQKFLDRTLALRNPSQHLRSKGWERKPVNIGVLRGNGPAAAFVRGS